ncbi:hypothetical protein [Ensifer aridi]|uniref:hypothetical protein n=1 Tax=Ensifer aridi TaxID=1708715 RepID=UPI003B847F9A
MCYSELSDIIGAVAAGCRRYIYRDLALKDGTFGYEYPNQIGPGVYDIHSS